ncbi:MULTISPECIES: S-layer homology domain-containing protein [Bacillus cereus group]|uniref:Uncharacterized protein n=1 Tax=Bacillus cereus TaxID=1396 RepID=A0A2C0EK99_BACCE|nr:S-layer homology domain-containing protein [Bacillus cereus]PDY83221.1 hypothetical protein CON06_05985 [Bacillus cereus]PFA02487.1 hypothetical protein CN382_30135 [Bacillus cereus]PFM31344.1 hypothetical protein COJ43_28565 [Bacillus cereus]PGL54756.1 hypothetical protein CN927_30365 [Bacillus cereus]PGQ06481.1 hypothetical protein COA08_22605 [Bacillus cereus]
MTAAMVAGVVSSVAAGKTFSDVQPGSWSEEYINYLVAKKAIEGKPDGTFDPSEAIDRASALPNFNADIYNTLTTKYTDKGTLVFKVLRDKDVVTSEIVSQAVHTQIYNTKKPLVHVQEASFIV